MTGFSSSNWSFYLKEQQAQAPAIENQIFKELFKEFDPNDFKSEFMERLTSGIRNNLPDLDLVSVTRDRQHPSDSIAKAMAPIVGPVTPHTANLHL